MKLKRPFGWRAQSGETVKEEEEEGEGVSDRRGEAGIWDALKQEDDCVSQQSRDTDANHSEQILQAFMLAPRQ
ncbi:hypothetical protein JOB18_015909 [Solea senegalensis]|uniref:Uncharacterized protein n=1 Tax=Solea senegalensis TaxID=28829 RepID=A0AAV6QB87_SOLSE|nr:hypothetical protein JOB18_015909 [Solea senegalensis]